MRTCTECGGEFVPRLQSPDQEACGDKCRDERKTRLRREARAKTPGYRHYEVAADSTPEEQEAQMRGLREKEKWIRAEYERTGREIEKNREASYKLWDDLLGISR